MPFILAAMLIRAGDASTVPPVLVEAKHDGSETNPPTDRGQRTVPRMASDLPRTTLTRTDQIAKSPCSYGRITPEAAIPSWRFASLILSILQDRYQLACRVIGIAVRSPCRTLAGQSRSRTPVLSRVELQVVSEPAHEGSQGFGQYLDPCQIRCR